MRYVFFKSLCTTVWEAYILCYYILYRSYVCTDDLMTYSTKDMAMFGA